LRRQTPNRTRAAVAPETSPFPAWIVGLLLLASLLVAFASIHPVVSAPTDAKIEAAHGDALPAARLLPGMVAQVRGLAPREKRVTVGDTLIAASLVHEHRPTGRALAVSPALQLPLQPVTATYSSRAPPSFRA